MILNFKEDLSKVMLLISLLTYGKRWERYKIVQNFNQEEEKKDALGNTIEKAPDEPKELHRAYKKRLQKLRKEMIKRGEDTYEIDLQLGLE